MQDQLALAYREIIRNRVSDPKGGFVNQIGGGYRIDATAWAAIALAALGQDADLLQAARGRLAAAQLADGRVSLSPQHPEAFWLTSLAIFAWHQAAAYREAQDRALRFLLATTGKHWPRQSDASYGHDPSLKGWPWIDATHSWVEPTALAIIALKITGFGEHARAKEGVRLLLDRQLPSGGWNYGNVKTFGQELFPFPESTGLALNALSGLAPQEQIQKSLDYLKSRVQGVRTPLALGWGLMGLASWGGKPAGAQAWISECLERQKRYGPYDTASLSLLIAASMAPKGMESIFSKQG
ncbi:MAG: prenyltransferase/squalene oxidase repeat-containing protein [Desulfobaccales bacterium]